MTTSTSIAVNPLQALAHYGQSVWLDYIRRSLITSGELQRLINEDGLRGVTSNPAIFEKAIAGSNDYHDVLEDPASRRLDAKALYEKIAVRDIQDAAGILRRSTRQPTAATATSAWKYRRSWPTTPRARSTRPAACGSRWTVPTS